MALAKQRDQVAGPGGGTRSSRPGTPGQAAMPVAATAGSTPTATSEARASSALATLCRPGSATAASTATPSGPYARNRCPYPSGWTDSARHVAVGSPAAEYVIVVGRSSGLSAGSSRFNTSYRHRPSNSSALAAKYSSTLV